MIQSFFIRVTEIDKRRAESEVCKDSIGFKGYNKNFYYTNVFFNHIEDFGITLVPNESSEFYYVDPSDRNKYIALDEYFNYLKVARVSELQKIAQDLGATHFRITYKEEKKAFAKHKMNAHANAKGKIGKVKANGNANVGHEDELNQFAAAHIDAEMDFDGHEPIKPTLHYLIGDQSIKSLIDMRLDENSTIRHQKLMIKMSSSSGIKEKDAAEIEGVFKNLKIAGNASLEAEVKDESRKYLEYEIDF